MNPEKAYIILRWCIGVVWLANGLLCKVLRLVPRHEQIVARILGTSYARPLTLLIGVLETCMAIWVFTGVKSKLNTWLQILAIATMNLLEFILVPDLLLQFFGYSSQLWKGKVFETTIHILSAFLWVYLSVVFLAIYIYPS